MSNQQKTILILCLRHNCWTDKKSILMSNCVAKYLDLSMSLYRYMIIIITFPAVSLSICHQRNDLFRFLNWHSLVNFPAFSACSYVRQRWAGSLMTMGKERQGNSVWFYGQWATGALQSSINSMCTAICSQSLCPNTAVLLYKLPCVVMYCMWALPPLFLVQNIKRRLR